VNRRFAYLLAISLAFGVTTPARADNASLAEALFRDARAAVRAGDYAAACPKFAESQRLDPSPGTLLNLGLCEEHEVRIASAWAHFRAAAEQLPSGDPRVRFATEHANALEPRVPHLRLALPPDASTAKTVSILLDGVALESASLGVPLPVDPGPHAIEAKTDAGVAVRSITVAEGETKDATIELPSPPQLSDASAPPAQMRAHSSARSTAGWALVATGGVGVAASLVLGGLVLKEKAVVADDCKAKKCSPAGLTAGHDGSIFAAASTVSIAVGVAALGGGTYLVLSAPHPGAPHGSGLSSVLLQGTF
jgi:hypothetical protein